MHELLTPDRLAAIRGRDQQALKRAEDPICPLDQAEYDRTLLLDEVDRLKQAEKRLALARDALLKDGYFTPDQVGPDIAPRITERVSSLRAEVERLSSLSRLATDRYNELGQLRDAVHRAGDTARAERLSFAMQEIRDLFIKAREGGEPRD